MVELDERLSKFYIINTKFKLILLIFYYLAVTVIVKFALAQPAALLPLDNKISLKNCIFTLALILYYFPILFIFMYSAPNIPKNLIILFWDSYLMWAH